MYKILCLLKSVKNLKILYLDFGNVIKIVVYSVYSIAIQFNYEPVIRFLSGQVKYYSGWIKTHP